MHPARDHLLILSPSRWAIVFRDDASQSFGEFKFVNKNLKYVVSVTVFLCSVVGATNQQVSGIPVQWGQRLVTGLLTYTSGNLHGVTGKEKKMDALGPRQHKS